MGAGVTVPGRQTEEGRLEGTGVAPVECHPRARRKEVPGSAGPLLPGVGSAGPESGPRAPRAEREGGRRGGEGVRTGRPGRGASDPETRRRRAGGRVAGRGPTAAGSGAHSSAVVRTPGSSTRTTRCRRRPSAATTTRSGYPGRGSTHGARRRSGPRRARGPTCPGTASPGPTRGLGRRLPTGSPRTPGPVSRRRGR